MARKQSVTVNLEPDQLAYLDDRDEPVSELVRQAIDETYGDET
jgi:hypothetical protein